MSRVVRHTIHALPLRSMQNTTGNETRTRSQVTFSSISILCRTFLLVFMLAFLFSTGVAQQSAAIEPCPATPDSNKVGLRTGGRPSSDTANVSETLIDASIPADQEIMKMLQPYRAKVAELDVVIGRLEGDLRKSGVGAGSLGNFVADGLRAEATRKMGKPAMIAVTNSGGLRKSSIAPGELRVQDIFELLPFENALIEVELTGEQLLKLLSATLAGGDAQSGARISYKLGPNNRPELVSAKLVDAKGMEKTINPKASYPIVTSDYLYGLGSGKYAILREGKSMHPIGTTMRDALIDYVRSETSKGRPVRATLDGRFTEIAPAPAKEASPK
jgi:2',3'-cyclic-nucleotide 2'-phosphodiesterase (5'-nucleotidase family)